MTPFEVMQQHYHQRDRAAREWKKTGGKVVGYFCDSVPYEMIAAAGAFPLRLSGDPREATDLARKHVIPRFAQREDFVHSMLNMLLTGKYDYVDLLVIPHARDSIHRLYQLLGVVKLSYPVLELPDIYFLDVLHTTHFSSGLYNRERLFEFKERLEHLSGKEITVQALSNAIATANKSRELLKEVAALRAAERPRISGVEALQIIGSSMFMPKEEHNILLKTYLETIDELHGRSGARILVSGSPLDNLQLYELIESDQATVVGEDHCWGNRYSDGLVETSLDPMEAIVERYQLKPPCARMFPLSRRIDYTVERAVEAKAQAVIFHVYEHSGAEAWEIPTKKEAIEQHGLAAFCLGNQPYQITDPNELREIQAFVTSV